MLGRRIGDWSFSFPAFGPSFRLALGSGCCACVDGVMGLTGVTKAFGDSLSYLRLFALGLASAQLAIVVQPAGRRCFAGPRASASCWAC